MLVVMLWVEERRWLGQLLLIHRLSFLWEMFEVVAGVDIPVTEQPELVVPPPYLLAVRQFLDLMECHLASFLPLQFVQCVVKCLCWLPFVYHPLLYFEVSELFLFSSQMQQVWWLEKVIWILQRSKC